MQPASVQPCSTPSGAVSPHIYIWQLLHRLPTSRYRAGHQKWAVEVLRGDTKGKMPMPPSWGHVNAALTSPGSTQYGNAPSLSHIPSFRRGVDSGQAVDVSISSHLVVCPLGWWDRAEIGP